MCIYFCRRFNLCVKLFCLCANVLCKHVAVMGHRMYRVCCVSSIFEYICALESKVTHSSNKCSVTECSSLFSRLRPTRNYCIFYKSSTSYKITQRSTCTAAKIVCLHLAKSICSAHILTTLSS